MLSNTNKDEINDSAAEKELMLVNNPEDFTFAKFCLT